MLLLRGQEQQGCVAVGAATGRIAAAAAAAAADNDSSAPAA